MKAASAAALVAALLLLGGTGSRAQDSGKELTGTLKHVKETGAITLGYRDSSIPFSYATGGADPIGYSMDLCKSIVDDVAIALGSNIAVKYHMVTSENRIAAVTDGTVDLECGSTTANFERKKTVSFSPVFFVAGTKLLVARASPVHSYRDLKGKTVVVTAGTTNEAAVKAISDKQQLGINFLVGPDHAASFAMVQSGKADAFATDDVLLYGLIATTHTGDKYHVVGDYLSYDPYGLMFRKDDADFAALIDSTFTRLAQSRELVQLYNRWFQQRLPTGESIGLPISPQLEEIFRVQGVPE